MKRKLRKSSGSLQGAFGRTQCTTFRWCIIAPSSKAEGLAPVRCQLVFPVLNQQIQLLLNRFAVEDERQKLHHIIIRQDGRLSQKGFQHPGTGAKAVRALTSGQAFQFALQPLLLVLGCGHGPLLAGAFFGGGVLLVWADVLARSVLDGGQELPVGVVTALLGGPFFALLVRRRT